MESHLQKIKDLLKLAASASEHESATAKMLADKLIAKYNVSQEQLDGIEASDKPLYDDEDLLLDTNKLEDWINILALIVAKKYDCFAIKEDNISSTGETTYRYYVYGEPNDVLIAKELFKYIYDEIIDLIQDICYEENEIYKYSFAEGCVNGAKMNIEYENFSTSGAVKAEASKQEIKSDAIELPEKAPLPPPPQITNRVKVINKEKELDPYAYFEGVEFGSDIHIGSVDIRKLYGSADIDDEGVELVNKSRILSKIKGLFS